MVKGYKTPISAMHHSMVQAETPAAPAAGGVAGAAVAWAPAETEAAKATRASSESETAWEAAADFTAS